jgi:hypothetical protein
MGNLWVGVSESGVLVRASCWEGGEEMCGERVC